MLERLIPSKTRVKLLTLFLLNPGREIYLREAQRMTGENLNAVRRGNARYYAVNTTFPIYRELTAIILKTEGVAKVVKEHLAGLGKIDSVFIFGSFASGEAGAASDIDLFVVGEVDEILLMTAVRKTEEELGREINYVHFRKEEMERRIAESDPFVTNVLREPRVMLIDND
jgi:predicted nucleotidyltransferase